MSVYDTASRDTTASRSRQPLFLGLAVALIGALAVGSYLLFSGTDEATVATATDVPAVTPVAGSDDDADDTDDLIGSSVPVTTYEVFLSRDPFERVVPEPAQPASTNSGETNDSDGSGTGGGSDGAGDDTSDGTNGSNGTNGSGDSDGNSTTPTDTDPPACVGQQELVCDGQVVTLLDVTRDGDDPVAVIQVDTTVYEVRRGQTFASNFQVRAIDGSCVSLLYGDDGFQLCRGDTVLK